MSRVLVPLLLATGEAPAQDDVPTFRVDTREVALHLSVVEKDGKLITGMPQSAFEGQRERRVARLGEGLQSAG